MIKRLIFGGLLSGLLFVSCSDDDNDSSLIAAGELTGGPFSFCVNDGTPDFVSGIEVGESDAKGANSTFVVTDDQGNILGLPPTLEALEANDFDGAGAGSCLIWYLTYEDGLQGAEVGMNASGLLGTFDLSDPIEVDRLEAKAGTISGGPFEFTIDGTPDYVSGISVDEEAKGTNSTFVVTDDQGNILGLPPTLEALEGNDFDGAGTGLCLIWYLRYEDGIQGAEVGMNTDDLIGCFSLSNSIEVRRN